MNLIIGSFVLISFASTKLGSGFVYPESQPDEDFVGPSAGHSFPGTYLPRDPFDTPYASRRPFRPHSDPYPWFFPSTYPRPLPWRQPRPSRDCDGVFCPVGTTCVRRRVSCFNGICRRQRRCVPNLGPEYPEPTLTRSVENRERPSYIS